MPINSDTLSTGELRGQTFYVANGHLVAAGYARGAPALQLVSPRKGKRGAADGIWPYGEFTNAAYFTDAAGNWYFGRWHHATGNAKVWSCKVPNYTRLPVRPAGDRRQKVSAWGALTELKRQAIETLSKAQWEHLRQSNICSLL